MTRRGTRGRKVPSRYLDPVSPAGKGKPSQSLPVEEAVPEPNAAKKRGRPAKTDIAFAKQIQQAVTSAAATANMGVDEYYQHVIGLYKASEVMRDIHKDQLVLQSISILRLYIYSFWHIYFSWCPTRKNIAVQTY